MHAWACSARKCPALIGLLVTIYSQFKCVRNLGQNQEVVDSWVGLKLTLLTLLLTQLMTKMLIRVVLQGGMAHIWDWISPVRL